MLSLKIKNMQTNETYFIEIPMESIEEGELTVLVTKYKDSPIELPNYDLIEGVETYSDLAEFLFKDKTRIESAVQVHRGVLKGQFTRYGYLYKTKEGERI